MKNKWAYAILVLVLIASACRDISPGNEDGANGDKKDASAIISFNNAFVQVDDRNNGYLQDVNTNLAKVVAEIQAPSPYFEISMPYEDPLLNSGEGISQVPASLSNADQHFFKTNIERMSALYNQIKNSYKTLYDYMRAEDYKDDNYVKGKSLVALLDSLGTNYYSIQTTVLQRLRPVTDDAERFLMADHPLKDFIYAMKDDNGAVEQLNKLLDSATVNYVAYADRAAIVSDQLSAQYGKHSVMILPGDAQYASHRDAFGRYYTTLNNYLTSIKKLMRNAAVHKKVDGADLEYLFNQQDALRVYYNDFVS